MKYVGTALAALSLILNAYFVSRLTELRPICPRCDATDRPDWVMLNEREIGVTDQVSWKEKLEGIEGPVTAVSLKDGSKFLVKDYWSVESSRPVFIQEYWNSKKPEREIKRALAIKGWPTSKWLIE